MKVYPYVRRLTLVLTLISKLLFGRMGNGEWNKGGRLTSANQHIGSLDVLNMKGKERMDKIKSASLPESTK